MAALDAHCLTVLMWRSFKLDEGVGRIGRLEVEATSAHLTVPLYLASFVVLGGGE